MCVCYCSESPASGGFGDRLKSFGNVNVTITRPMRGTFGRVGAGAGLGAGLRVRCLYGTDARMSVQVRGRTRASQHPYLFYYNASVD